MAEILSSGLCGKVIALSVEGVQESILTTLFPTGFQGSEFKFGNLGVRAKGA